MYIVPVAYDKCSISGQWPSGGFELVVSSVFNYFFYRSIIFPYRRNMAILDVNILPLQVRPTSGTWIGHCAFSSPSRPTTYGTATFVFWLPETTPSHYILLLNFLFTHRVAAILEMKSIRKSLPFPDRFIHHPLQVSSSLS